MKPHTRNTGQSQYSSLTYTVTRSVSSILNGRRNKKSGIMKDVEVKDIASFVVTSKCLKGVRKTTSKHQLR
jgi:hypothetical protein